MVTTLRLDDLVVAVPADGSRWRAAVTVRGGEFVAVRARPAAGAALARTVAGLAAPVSGAVLLDDRDVTAVPPVERHIGYVPPGGGLLPHLTVAENIEYGQLRQVNPHERVESRRKTAEALLELGPLMYMRPHLLSEAQRLRVAVARTVVCMPAVVVFDLPYGTSGRPRDLLSRVQSGLAQGMSGLVCTSDEDLLADADRVERLEPEAST